MNKMRKAWLSPNLASHKPQICKLPENVLNPKYHTSAKTICSWKKIMTLIDDEENESQFLWTIWSRPTPGINQKHILIIFLCLLKKPKLWNCHYNTQVEFCVGKTCWVWPLNGEALGASSTCEMQAEHLFLWRPRNVLSDPAMYSMIILTLSECQSCRHELVWCLRGNPGVKYKSQMV